MSAINTNHTEEYLRHPTKDLTSTTIYTLRDHYNSLYIFVTAFPWCEFIFYSQLSVSYVCLTNERNGYV